MVQAILVGLVSGVAAALLFARSARQRSTPFGVPPFRPGLDCLLAIAGFGWGHHGACCSPPPPAALGVVALVDWPEAVIFAGMFLAISRCLDDPQSPMQPRPEAAGGGWWPVGILLLNAAAAVAICTIAVSFIVEVDPQTLVTEFSTGLADLAGSLNPDAAPLHRRQLRAAGPGADPAAARHRRAGRPGDGGDRSLPRRTGRPLSRRLRRPQEKLRTAAMPWTVSAAFVVATAIAFAPGTVGFAARAVAGSLGLAVALIGLAVIHALTRGMNIRITLLSTLYVLLVLLSGLMLPLLSLAPRHRRERVSPAGAPPEAARPYPNLRKTNGETCQWKLSFSSASPA